MSIGRIASVLALLVVLAFYLSAALRWFPTHASLRTDSSIFAYGGEELLDGRIPYRDFWDHKPPFVYLVNALAIRVFGYPPVSLWAFGMLWLLVVQWFLYRIGKAMFGSLPSLLGTLLTVGVLLHPDYYQDGNMTEQYALLFQVPALYSALRSVVSMRRLPLVAVGLLGGLCFLTKQTAIGTPVAVALIVLYTGLRRPGPRRPVLDAALMAGGAILPLALTASLWIGLGAWNALWEATWEFNVLYPSPGSLLSSLLATLRALLLDQPMSGLATLGLGGLFFAVAERREEPTRGFSGDDPENRDAPREYPREGRSFVTTCAAVSIPIDVLLVSLSGRGYAHYYVALLPALGLLTMRLADAFVMELALKRRVRPWFGAALGLAVSIVLAWGLEAFTGLRPREPQLDSLPQWIATRRLEVPPEIAYAVANTRPQDPHPGGKRRALAPEEVRQRQL